jgi:hypothetical protein
MADWKVMPVTKYLATCLVDGCDWEQEHLTPDNAEADAMRHNVEWHAPEPEGPARIEDLMKALEASLAAVRERRAP